MPDETPLEQPFQTRPTPEVLDSLVWEIVDPTKADYVYIPEGQYHPKVREFPAHRLIKEERLSWNRVRRWWSDGFENQNTYNYDIGYDHESASFPMYVRRYLIRRDQQSASTRNAAFTGVWQIRVTAGGTGYGDDTTVTVAAPGAGTTATALPLIRDGVVVWIKIVTEGSGYTSAPVVTITGTGGSGATATAVVQTTAVLVSEKYQDLPEDDNRRSLYIACVRVWKILPGPVMESKEWGIGGLQKQTQTTDVAPSTELTGGDNLLGEQMKEVTKTESQHIVEKLLTAEGDPISGDAEWTEETREGTSGVTFYRTYRFVDTNYTFPREGTAFKTGYFLDGQIDDLPGSPQFLAQFNWVKSDLGQVVFNTEREFVAESITHPIFAISRLVPIEDYSPSTVDAAFGEVLIADLTNGGSGYTSAPTLGTSGGGGSGFAGVAQVESGVIVSIRITNGGSGFTGNTTITFTGGGGSGAAASGIIIPTSAVLVSQRARPAEGNLRPLFYRVLRIYKTLPGPTLTSVEWAAGGLIKRREVTDILPSTALTTVGAGTLNLLGEEIKSVTTAESQRIVETLRAPDGTALGAAGEYTLAERDGIWEVTVYTTFRIVAADFTLYPEGSEFSITYPAVRTGRVIEGKLRQIEGSPNCLAEIVWSDVPLARTDFVDTGYTFPGEFLILQDWWDGTNNLPYRRPWEGIDIKTILPKSLSVTGRRTLIFTNGAIGYQPVPYRVISPGSGSKVYPSITPNMVHPALVAYTTVADNLGNSTTFQVENIEASTPASYDPFSVLIRSSSKNKWRGRWYVTEIVEVSEARHPSQFAPLFVPFPLKSTTQVDLVTQLGDAPPDGLGLSQGTLLLASSSAADTRTVKIQGKVLNENGVLKLREETITLNGTTTVATTRDNWIKLNQITLSASGAQTVEIRTPGTANSGSIEIGAVPTTGTVTITRDPGSGVVSRTYTFTAPETTDITCGTSDTIGAKATGTLTLNSNPIAGDTFTLGIKTYTFKAAITGADNVDGNVLIGASASASIDNAIAAINLDVAGAGSTYAGEMTANTLASAAAGAGDTMVATAISGGAGGNLIATTETFTDAASIWTGVAMTGGLTGYVTVYDSVGAVKFWFKKSASDSGPAITLPERRVTIDLIEVIEALGNIPAADIASTLAITLETDGFLVERTDDDLVVADSTLGARTDSTATNMASPWSVAASIQGIATAANQVRLGPTADETAEALLQTITDRDTAVANGQTPSATTALSYEANIQGSREEDVVTFGDRDNLNQSLITWTLSGHASLTLVTPTGGDAGPLVATFAPTQTNAYREIDFWNLDLEENNLPALVTGITDSVNTASRTGHFLIRVKGAPSIRFGYQTSADNVTFSGTTNLTPKIGSVEGSTDYPIYRLTMPVANYIKLTFDNSVSSKARAVHAAVMINVSS